MHGLCSLPLPQCEISPKKSAGLVRKVLLQAKANAVTNTGLMESHLRVGAPRRRACYVVGALCCCGRGAGSAAASICRCALPACSLTPHLAHWPPAAEAWVGKGQHLKRVSLHGRGRSGQRLRYRSHLTVSGGACLGVLRCWPAAGALRVVVQQAVTIPSLLTWLSCPDPPPCAAPPQVMLREEEHEPRRRTRILPQLQERQRWLRVREGAAQQQQRQQRGAAA